MDKYGLPRDSQESSRLTLQHYMYKERQGFWVHPKIAVDIKDKSEVSIADIATGTGIWAFDVAQQFPNAKLTGLDISSNQFPAQWIWPSNVKLGLLDITKDIPEDYREAFDVVHVRLLLPCGPPWENPGTYLNQLTGMLKPGGWIQLDELGYQPSLLVLENMPGPRVQIKDMKEADKVATLMKAIDFEGRLELINNFGKITSEYGKFGYISHDAVPVLKHSLAIEHDMMMSVWTSILRTFLSRNDLDDDRKQEMVDAIEIARRRKEKEEFMVFNWNICIAQLKG